MAFYFSLVSVALLEHDMDLAVAMHAYIVWFFRACELVPYDVVYAFDRDYVRMWAATSGECYTNPQYIQLRYGELVWMPWMSSGKGKGKGKGKGGDGQWDANSFCRDFQAGTCTRGAACRFQHVCQVPGCGSTEHGRIAHRFEGSGRG